MSVLTKLLLAIVAIVTVTVSVVAGTVIYLERSISEKEAAAAAAKETSTAVVNVTNAPTNVVIDPSSKVTATVISISWTAAQAVSGYNVFCSQQPKPTSPVNTSPVTSTTYTFFQLSSDTTYYIGVQSIGLDGVSLSVTVYLFTGVTTTYPGPTSIEATSVSQSSVTLSWTPISIASSYSIYWGVSNPFTMDVAVGIQANITSTAPYIINNLPPAWSYIFGVVAHDSNNVSSQMTVTSGYVNGSTPQAGYIVATTPSTTSLIAVWSVSTGYLSNVYYDTVTPVTASSPMAILNFQGTQFVIQNLIPSTYYYIGVQAVNPANNSVSIMNTSEQPYETTFVGPAAITATTGANSLQVSWNAALSAVSYTLLYGTSSPPTTAIAKLTGTTYLLSGLSTYASYYLGVSGTDINGQGSTITYATQKYTTQFVGPSALSITGIQSAQVNVSWPSAVGAASYTLLYGSTSPPKQVWSNNASSPTVISPLSSSTYYYFSVYAVDVDGNISTTTSSNAVSTTFLGPASISFVSSTDTTMTWSWPSAVRASTYNVFVGTSTSTITNQVGTNVTSPFQCPTGSLTASTPYFVGVQGLDANGNVSQTTYNFTANNTLPPTATILVVDTATANGLTLRWSSPGNIQGVVYYGTTSPLTTSNANAFGQYSSPCAVNVLNASTYYYFGVALVDSYGSTGAFTATTSAYETLFVPPTSITATNATINSAIVSWPTAATATSYQLYYGTSSNATPNTAVGGQITSGMQVTGLRPTTTYYFTVTATDINGQVSSPTSPYATINTLSSPVTNIQSTGATAQSLTIGWDTTSNQTYTVYLSTTSPVSSSSTLTASNATSPCTIQNLSASTYYYIRVDSSDVYGYSTSATATSTYRTTFIGPATLTSTASSGNSITLTWDTAVAANTYQILYGTAVNPTTVASTNATKPYTVSSLQGTTKYYFAVTCTDVNGNVSTTTLSQPYSTSFVGPASVTPSTPNTSPDKSINISWPSAINAFSYNTYWSTSTPVTKTNSTQFSAQQAGLVATVTGLASSTYYYFGVSAYNSSTSTESMITTTTNSYSTQFVGPSTVTAVNGSLTVNSMSVQWPGATRATSYQLMYATATPVTTSNSTAVPGNVTSPYSLGGLSANTTYYVGVQCTDSNGLVSTITSSAAIQTLFNGPTNISATTPGNTSLVVNWTNSAGAASYNLYYSTSPTVTTSSSAGPTGVQSGVTVPNLNSDTAYYFGVVGVSGSGSTSVLTTSNTSSTAVSTLFAPAASLTLSAATCSSVRATWPVVYNASSYTVYYGTTSPLTTSNATGSTANVSSPYDVTGLTASTTYYCGVTAMDSSSNMTALTTSSGLMTTAYLAPPTAVSLSFNATGSIITVAWQSGTSGVNYSITMTGSDGSSYATTTTTLSCQFGVTVPSSTSPATMFTAKVASSNSAGTTTTYPVSGSYTLQPIPIAPSISVQSGTYYIQVAITNNNSQPCSVQLSCTSSNGYSATTSTSSSVARFGLMTQGATYTVSAYCLSNSAGTSSSSVTSSITIAAADTSQTSASGIALSRVNGQSISVSFTGATSVSSYTIAVVNQTNLTLSPYPGSPVSIPASSSGSYATQINGLYAGTNLVIILPYNSSTKMFGSIQSKTVTV